MRSIKAILTVIAAMLVCIAASPVAAQTLRGSVVLPDGATPVAGAIVVAKDGRGATAGRVLTTARGEFTVRLAAEGTYFLTVFRIGFRPTVLPPTTVAAGATETVRVVFGGEAVTLAAVNVRDRETCRVSADTGLAVTRVWEEARKAMLSSQLSAESAPLIAQWIEYDRVLDSAARYVRQQRIRTSKSPTTHAFKSAPAALLDTAGYIVADSTGTTYYLPDAEVLLSSMFASTHCFRLQAPPRDAANLIGVTFSPTRDRGNVREVEGTAWVDRQTAELKSLDLRYTNLPAVLEAAKPGGRVEFLRLSDGNWLINRWNVRMPQLGVTTTTTVLGLRSMRGGASAIVRATQVAGGEIDRVTRRDSVLYEWHGPHLRVQIQGDSSTMRPAGALFTVEGTDYSGRANADGLVDLSPVLAGRYRALIRTPLMDSLGMPGAPHDVETHDDVRVDTLRLPPARELLALVCPKDSIAHGEGMLRGRVFDQQHKPLRHGAVVVRWQSDFSTVGGVTSHLYRSEKTIGSLSDEEGNWRLCGVPREIPLFVSLTTDAGSAVRETRLISEFASVDLELGIAKPTPNENAIIGSGINAPRSALVEVAVYNIAGAAVPDVTLDVEPPSGAPRRIVTGPSGRALIPDIAPGMLKIRARRIGFKEGQVAVTVDAGRNTVPIILGETVAPTLDTVRVIGGRSMIGRLDEFETRRLNKMATVSISREDIVKRNPIDIYELLRGIPSIQISDTAGVTAHSTRSYRVLPDGRQKLCYLAVMVDGLILTPTNGEAVDLRQLPRPEEIHGVEVFAGASSIPVQYGGVGSGKWCGLIAVWTRSGGK